MSLTPSELSSQVTGPLSRLDTAQHNPISSSPACCHRLVAKRDCSPNWNNDGARSTKSKIVTQSFYPMDFGIKGSNHKRIDENGRKSFPAPLINVWCLPHFLVANSGVHRAWARPPSAQSPSLLILVSRHPGSILSSRYRGEYLATKYKGKCRGEIDILVLQIDSRIKSGWNSCTAQWYCFLIYLVPSVRFPAQVFIIIIKH